MTKKHDTTTSTTSTTTTVAETTTTTTEPPPTTTEAPATTVTDTTTTTTPATTTTVYDQCPDHWYPASYEPDAECVPYDPCIVDATTGRGSTLWHVVPCGDSVDVGTPTTASTVGTVALDAAPTLPATGAETVIAGWAFVAVAIGTACVAFARRGGEAR